MKKGKKMNESVKKKDEVIKHLYFFDDLTYHVERICLEKNIDRNKIRLIKTKIWSHLNDAFACLDMGYQDYNLINWDHVCADLGDKIDKSEKVYDMAISQGCNGEYAMKSFASKFEQKYDKLFSKKVSNVRVAHFLTTPDNPFYSDFQIGVSRGDNLLQQCKAVVDELTGEKSPVKIAVFDDCIQTGKGTKAVVDNIKQLLDATYLDCQIDIIGFIGCEKTMNDFHKQGFGTMTGVMLRGDTYPNTWENDIYFLKDLLLSNAVRFTDGTSVAYCDLDWYLKIFPLTPDLKSNSYTKLKAYLKEEGLLETLEAL